jgi:hypothetical protein
MKFDKDTDSSVTSQDSKETKIVDLASFRQKKASDDDLARGRKPLYVSHMKGKVTGSPHLKSPEASDFGDRLQRIRTSLEKINSLMVELKKMSASSESKNVQK